MFRDCLVENPMVTPFPELKQIREPIDEADLARLKEAADLLEKITDNMNTDLEHPFRAELWKVLDRMNAKIEELERRGSNPFEAFDMVRYAEKVCGRR